MTYTPVVGTAREQNQQNLDAGRCDVYTNERGGLAASRTAMKKPDDWMVLPDVLYKEPTGQIVRQDDTRFRDTVAWPLNALNAAEEAGIIKATVDQVAAESSHPEAQRPP